MELCIQLLNARIAKHQFNEIENDFAKLTPVQQTQQLHHLFQSAQRMSIKYNFMQNVATRILSKNTPPGEFIEQFNNLEALSFFTPALKINKGFLAQDKNANNVLHTIFTHSRAEALPFNYVRSLMLFESNEDLLHALAQPNKQGLSPVGCYIAFANKPSIPVKHEFSALLALMEIEQKHSAPNKKSLITCINAKSLNEATLLLSAAYLQCSTAALAHAVKVH
jgi:hypothetical protein